MNLFVTSDRETDCASSNLVCSLKSGIAGLANRRLMNPVSPELVRAGLGENKKMWVQIILGVGSPGKLWTGSDVSPQSEDRGGPKVVFGDVELVEFHSPESGATTRRLFVRETRNEAPEGIRIPTLRIFTGGVGSLVSGRVVREPGEDPSTPREEDNWLMPLLVWNWTGRVGGYIILDPVMIESGYIRRDEMNSALPGYAWIHTYEGSTLSEYVLVRTHQADSNEDGEQPSITSVAEEHVLPIHRVVRTLLSPPEREARLRERAEKFLEAEVISIEEIADSMGYPLEHVGNIVGSEDLTTIGGLIQSSLRRSWKGLDQLVERKLNELEWAAIQEAPPEPLSSVDDVVTSWRPRREPRPSRPERVPRPYIREEYDEN